MGHPKVEFTDHSFEIKEQMKDELITFLYEAAGELTSQAKRNTPVDFGQLKSSWAYVVKETRGEAVIGSPLENAVWNEFGTGQYALNGNGRKGAWFVPEEGYVGTKKPTYNGRVVVVHGKNGKKYFKTNGKRPQRSLTRAVESTKPKIIRELKKRLEVVTK